MPKVDPRIPIPQDAVMAEVKRELDALRVDNDSRIEALRDVCSELEAERELYRRERLENDAMRAENERLKEEMAEWESAHAAAVELRGLVESHMDTSRGQWECVAEIERLRAIKDAAVRMYEHRETGDRPLIDTLGDWLEAKDALYAAVEALVGDKADVLKCP